MTTEEKAKFFSHHIPHRLTLLRAFRNRVNEGYDFNDKKDIYRCLKDSNLIAVRLFLEFLGIKGIKEDGIYKLRSFKSNNINDVQVDRFIGSLIELEDINDSEQRILSGVFLRANKELAHFTETYYDEFNEPEILIFAATIIEELLKKHLYDPLGIQLPEIDI